MLTEAVNAASRLEDLICTRQPPRQRGGRKLVMTPDGVALGVPRRVVDSTIVKALVRANRWKIMLESGEYASVTDLAKAEKINLSYLCRVLRLTLLAPDITEALLNGRHGCRFQLMRSMPVSWAEQRIKFDEDGMCQKAECLPTVGGLVHRFRNSNCMPRHSGSRPKGPRARNPVITGVGYWIPGSPLRGAPE